MDMYDFYIECLLFLWFYKFPHFCKSVSEKFTNLKASIIKNPFKLQSFSWFLIVLT